MAKSTIKILKEGDSVYIDIKNLGIAKKKQGNSWTFYCPNLKIIGYSNKSEKEALSDFEENLSLFFTVHIKDNTLDRALESFNWNKRTLSLAEVLKAKKELTPKLEFTTNKKSAVLESVDFKVPVLDLAA